MKRIPIVVLTLFVCLTFTSLSAQKVSTKGDVVGNPAIKKVLNSPVAVSSFSQLTSTLTIVDFFGTWCVPCLKALPKLAALKEQFGAGLNIVLVSNETEAQLNKFIATRKGFLFPVIVDEDNEWTNLFQPPSLPYTVVVKNGKVIAVTEAEKLSPDSINKWLLASQQEGNLPTDNKRNRNFMVQGNRRSNNEAVQLSQTFLYNARTGESLSSQLDSLKNYPYDRLRKMLVTDNEKKAFWINLYNGYVQSSLKNNPEQYKSRNRFFKENSIEVAGQKLSLDDIEHGILRHSKIKWSLGYLDKLFPSKVEKSLRVNTVDYRIHFALNCGAKSCPPVAFYNDEMLDAQLDQATKSFLTSETAFDTSSNTVALPKILSWFRGDFGGKKGIKKMLKKFAIIPEDTDPKIKFNDYDWTLSLNNYTNQNP